MNKNRKISKKLVPLAAAVLVAGTAAGWKISQIQEVSATTDSAYKTETVRKGTVSSGISESGTVTYGTTEQTFSVAEITEVSLSSDSSDSDNSSSSQALGGSTSGSSGASGQGTADMAAMQGAAGDNSQSGSQSSGQSNTGSTTSSGTDTSLVVEEVYAATGQVVAEGDPILKITDDSIADYQAQLEAAVEIAQLNVKQEEINVESKKSEADYTYQMYLAEGETAEETYQATITSLENTVSDLEDDLADFQEQIGDGIVYAQESGTVTEVAYASGDDIVSDATLVTYTDPENVTMTVSVSQDDISSVSVGEEVSITLTAYPDETFTGSVSSIATSATTGSSTVNYDVTVLFSGDISKVYSGMTGEAAFAGKTVGDTLYISNQAVYLDGTKSCVKVLAEDGSVRVAEITTGYSNGKVVAVESGLEEGETILIESQVES